jgi:PAS domain S-box-containing protein
MMPDLQQPASGSFYQQMLEAAGYHLLTVTRELRLIAADSGFASLSGYPQDQPADCRRLWDKSGDSQRVFHQLGDLSPGETALLETIIHRADGQACHVEIVARAREEALDLLIRERSGPKSVSASGDPLRQQEPLYYVLARSLPDMTVMLFDHELRYIMAAGEPLQAAGFDPSQVEGRTLFDILPPADAEKSAAYYRSALEGNRVQFDTQYNDRSYQCSTVPVRDESGQVIGGMLLVQDVTRMLRTQTELRQHVSQLTLLAEVDAELVDQLNLDYVLTLALDAALRLSTADAGFIGVLEGEELRLARLVGDYPERTLNAYLRRGAGIVPRVLSQQRAELIPDVRSDPDYIDILPRTIAQIAIPLISQDNLIGVINLETSRANVFTVEIYEFLKLMTARIAVALDNARLYRQTADQLDELQRLYERVTKLEELKTDMIRIASHDLRNPLMVVVSNLGLLRAELTSHLEKDLVPPSATLDYIESIQTASNRMRKIITDILSLERIEEAAQEAHRSRMDLKPLVQRAYDDLGSLARIKAHDYRLSIEAVGQLEVNGDEVQLFEALTNLIGNAIKYTPDGGRVLVSLTQENGQVLFRVQDSGIGIREQQQARLFQPFFRARSPETRDIEGTGLGLHLVKNIIERHEGEMFFESVYQQGSTFGFALPLYQLRK